MKLKEMVQEHVPKARLPNSNPPLNKGFHILSQRENSLLMDSRIQESNIRRRDEVGIAVTDHAFPAMFIKDGLGSKSTERNPKAGASGARTGQQEELWFSQRRVLQ